MANWKTCKTHGPERSNVWGCPECLRELREESARLRADAARYRWLRTNALDCQETEGLEIVRLIPAHRSPNHADIDTAIDAAMAIEPNCDRSACGDHSPGNCDHPDCPARLTPNVEISRPREGD